MRKIETETEKMADVRNSREESEKGMNWPVGGSFSKARGQRRKPLRSLLSQRDRFQERETC